MQLVLGTTIQNKIKKQRLCLVPKTGSSGRVKVIIVNNLGSICLFFRANLVFFGLKTNGSFMFFGWGFLSLFGGREGCFLTTTLI
jgi:hypothetical protein